MYLATFHHCYLLTDPFLVYCASIGSVQFGKKKKRQITQKVYVIEIF